MKVLEGRKAVSDFVAAVRAAAGKKIRRVAFEDCRDWHFTPDGAFAHRSGRYFSVAGISAPPTMHSRMPADCVMIDQPEVGWLAFLVRPSDAGLQWLLQAKTEPGNLAETSIAPTVQATRSNFERVHGGEATRFLDRLTEAPAFLSDAPHSEQGTKFLWKFNRNSVAAVEAGMEPEAADGRLWRWATSAALRESLSVNHLVNTDARSVIATAPWALLADGGPLFSADVLRASYELEKPWEAEQLKPLVSPLGPLRAPNWRRVPLTGLEGWQMRDGALRDPAGQEAVACYDVELAGREVGHWQQPFLVGTQPAEQVLFMRIDAGKAEFYLRVYHEVGFGRRREFGASTSSEFDTPPFLRNWRRQGEPRKIMALRQSDEGGRFMRADAVYRIVLLQNPPPKQRMPVGAWVDLSTLEKLCRTAGRTTNELRTLASMILSRAFDAACADL
ncbi:NDP-hexose 2,3-dehydratase [Pseudoruegeria aquimaris]|uniref:NDP-hexose 2,3-dehydratase n=1 Tax=Pseudoruegeria aquimaris TaxID=393663 RepID=A0A1Y5T870_9RHOB|nr:NDP-hexose 2,3-dehydratase family protein [Pseudoruegeria aquimaris]SLN56150.1 NDP-hexose 2,3-dehydratase [Pseudoruegeria aquimaris]